MMPEYPITLDELAQAKVFTAREIWFMWDSGAREIHESRGTLGEMLMRGHKVNIILAKKDEPWPSDQKPGTHLGIFYHTQSAATCAYALCHYLAGDSSRFLELAQSNDDLCYGPIERRYIHPITVKAPIVANIQLIGGGKIHQDARQDEPTSHTLETNFAFWEIPPEYMALARRLALGKLWVE